VPRFRFEKILGKGLGDPELELHIHFVKVNYSLKKVRGDAEYQHLKKDCFASIMQSWVGFFE